MVVVLGPSSTAHHLQHVGDGHVDVAACLAVVELGAFDDNKVRWKVDTPGQCRRRDQNLQQQTTGAPLNRFLFPV